MSNNSIGTDAIAVNLYSNAVSITGPLTDSLNSTGSGKYLTSTGTGVVWSTVPSNLPAGAGWGDYIYYNGSAYATGSANVIIGRNAGFAGQGTGAVAIGNFAGYSTMGSNAVAIGSGAGYSKQGTGAIAIGNFAGYGTQGSNAVAIGNFAGYSQQNSNAVAIGNYSGYQSQGSNAVAIGNYSGYQSQGSNAVAIGNFSGFSQQGSNAVAIGNYAGAYSQSSNAIAIGSFAGATQQGSNAIAIGNYAGYGSVQSANSIVLNATGVSLSTITTGLYVAPLRSNVGIGGSTLYANTVMYSAVTNELFYVNVPTNVGSAGVASKTFVIDHPSKKDKYLVHACLEGPEAGVYYRGDSCIHEGESISIISLPDYVDSLATDFTIGVTPIGEPRVLGVSRVKDGKFTVYGPPGEFFWTVYGKRTSIEVEPLKSSVKLKGDGPYTYLSSEL